MQIRFKVSYSMATNPLLFIINFEVLNLLEKDLKWNALYFVGIVGPIDCPVFS